MAKKIKVLIKRPDSKIYSTHISDTLENLQKIVGGYIETVTLWQDATVICNEEGRIKELPYNCNIAGVDFYGTVIIVGVDGEEFGDVPIDLKEAKILFPNLFSDTSSVTS